MSDRPSPYRVCIVGYGLAGRVFHAPLIEATRGLELAAVVTTDPDRVARAARELPHVAVFAHVDEALADDPVDLVVVATANDAHVPVARRAIERGVAVVVDKPLAASAEDGRRLVEEAERAGVPLTVFQNRRWDGDFLTVRHVLAEERLGRVHRVETRFERWAPRLRVNSWRERPEPDQAGGLLFDLGAHLIDQAVVLCGPVRNVYAELERRRAGSAVDDDVFVALEHSGGVRSHLWAGALVPRPGPRFRLLGDRAAFTSDGLDPQEAQLASGMRPGSQGWGLTSPPRSGLLGAGDDVDPMPLLAGAYERFYAEVAAALAGQGPLPVDARDAVRVLEVIEAAQRSAANRAAVSM